jgi:hypothetical protein
LIRTNKDLTINLDRKGHEQSREIIIAQLKVEEREFKKGNEE